ncbi:MAG: GNAT family N-acetyltransferase [Alphaproteobacteria bacterium]|nr:GNAT family N-acetyltransferase [Alphaproteobacteria bacterium]
MAHESQITVRAAHVREAHALSELCVRSKAHWGYDDAFMAQARPSLTVSTHQIEGGDVWIAEIDGKVAGMVALAKLDEPGLVDLDKLFVEPSRIGSGTGRALMEIAVAQAKARGYTRMAILADPNAAKFYERMGAVYIADKASDAIPGRLLPYFELRL